jgi:hypothetical protein
LRSFYRRHGPLTCWLIALAALALIISLTAAFSPVGERIADDEARTACGTTVLVATKIQEPAARPVRRVLRRRGRG